jgi:hypothetical protein
MTQYSERELVLPALALLDASPDGLTTTDLIRELSLIFKPDGRDAELSANRNDTRFSQKVRNLVSHERLTRPGWDNYDPDRQHHSITAAGRHYVAEGRERGDLAGQLIPTAALPPAEVFPDYQPANEAPTTEPRQPFSVDPNQVDRALGAHAATQNALAAWVRSKGMSPLRPGGSAADFDLAWDDGVTLAVAEVKSLTPSNETGQLRLGMGQVLHYGMLLGTNGRATRAVLAVERAPTDPRWVALCAAHGVTLVWPGEFDRLDVAAMARHGGPQ